MTVTPHYRSNGRKRTEAGPVGSRAASHAAAGQRPYRQSHTRRSGRAYIESRLLQVRPPATLSSGAGYQPTMAIDFATALVPSARTLREEMEALRWTDQPKSDSLKSTRNRPGKRSASGGGRRGGGNNGNANLPASDGEPGEPLAPRPWVLRHKKLVGFLATFSVVMLVFGIYVAPVLIAGARAYREVFVDSGPRATTPAIAITNAQLTPVTAQQAASQNELTPTPHPEWNGTDPVTLLLLGVDRRDEEASRAPSSGCWVASPTR